MIGGNTAYGIQADMAVGCDQPGKVGWGAELWAGEEGGERRQGLLAVAVAANMSRWREAVDDWANVASCYRESLAAYNLYLHTGLQLQLLIF